MVKSLVVAVVLATAIPQTAPAPVSQAATPGGCVADLKTYSARRQEQQQWMVTQAMAAVQPPPSTDADRMAAQQAAMRRPEIFQFTQDTNAARLAMARGCVARFDVKTVAATELADLFFLYQDALQPDATTAAVTSLLARTWQTPGERATALAAAVTAILREPKGDERNTRLEKLVSELDAIPSATLDQKFGAHSSMLGYYRYDDLDGGIIKHATWIINASKTFTPEQRRRYDTTVVSAHVDMAEAWAGQGMNDQALALLKRARTEWADARRVSDYVDPEIARLELVGTVGAPLTAPHWLNMPGGKTELDMTGAVTLLEFSAHWCVPCKESYPGINRLRAKYGQQGFRVVVATQLWGYFQQERPLAADAEIDRDRTYFAEHGLDVPIAIGDRPGPPATVDGKRVYQRDPNDDHYRVGGIPQIQLIDKHGKIRLMMVGYDDANEGKLAKMIEGLLKEK